MNHRTASIVSSDAIIKQHPSPIAGNTATGTLKILALLFMFADHAGKMLLPGIQEMRIIGRLAFPLYCWCLVVGFHYTRSVPRYLLRLLGVGLLSQPLYVLALDHTWNEPNIFLTLLMGLCALWGLREKRWGSHIWAPPVVLLLSVWLNCNYGWKGVLMMILLYAVRGSKAGIAAVMTAFCLYWGSSSAMISQLFGWSLRPVTQLPLLGELLQPWLRLQGLAILALPMMLIPMPNIKLPIWAGYLLYPAHLALLYLLECLL